MMPSFKHDMSHLLRELENKKLTWIPAPQNSVMSDPHE
jgi:hypothetical protein